MKIKNYLPLFGLIFVLPYISIAQSPKNKKYVIGYVFGVSNTAMNVAAIDASKLTHINYAFVNCIDSMAVLINPKTDSINFSQLNTLKRKNPDLKILISLGGATRSKNFSDAVLTPSSRALFAKTSVDILRQHKLDGVDVDWEFPGQGGGGNKFRPEDKQNFTLMFMELRKELDRLGAETGKKYLLTAALGTSPAFLANTEMGEVGKIVDFLNVMTYDFSGPDGKVGHHTNLYSYNPEGPGRSADQAIKNLIAAGVPANKLTIGVALYGKAVAVAGIEHNGLLQQRLQGNAGTSPAAGQARGYTQLKENVIDKNGYKRFWDEKAKAPYLFNAEKKVFISYDDEESAGLKARYVKDHNLAGIFFWQYFNDPKGYLLNAIDKTLEQK